MRLPPDDYFHLTYCTNIHAADGWQAVDANLRRYGPELKRRFSPDRPFGLGLRLSARDARELLDGQLDRFRAFLADEGLYVAILNGFPHGSFHRSVVKADVYAPDWRDPARVRYTTDLVTILAALLPDDVDGGVSTAPLSYKPWLRGAPPEDWQTIVRHLTAVAHALVRVHRDTGKLIHLDIEPEPDCTIENTDETLSFFERWLLPDGAPLLAEALGETPERARDLLLRHIRVCFDCCHFAVEYEDPIAALTRLRAAGIQIGRIQLSSALDIAIPADPILARHVATRLRPFADSTYLHQVIERRDRTLVHYPDLGDALDRGTPASPAEWRIHFHVPLFTDEYDGLRSTQDYVRAVLDAAHATRVTRHLEIETYTWDVLPAALKIDLLESIAREYDWVLASWTHTTGSHSA